MSWQQREMTPEQFARALAQLKLSRDGAGRFLGVSGRQIRRYVHGEQGIPGATSLLLRSMLQHGDVPEVPKRPKRSW
jgi:hypothetical protein